MICFLVCLFADDETYISVKSFDKSVSVKSSTLGPSFIRKDLLERYLVKWIKSLVGHLQIIVRNLILPQIFPIGQNVWCVFCLVNFLFQSDTVPCLIIISKPGYMEKLRNFNSNSKHII